MVTLQDLSQYLQQLLSPADFADYCPNGLQVEGKGEIKKIAFAVSASLAVIEEAVKREADALIVHHGIFWNKDPHVVIGTRKDKLALLLKHGISLLAYHLPLDAHQKLGNNWKAAFDLGLEDLNPFALSGKTAIGVKGRMGPISTEAFQKSSKLIMATPPTLRWEEKKKFAARRSFRAAPTATSTRPPMRTSTASLRGVSMSRSGTSPTSARSISLRSAIIPPRGWASSH